MLGRAMKLNTSSTVTTYTDAKQIPIWSVPYIVEAASAGIISGYTDGSFKPNKPLNRAELVTMIARASSTPEGSTASLSFEDREQIPAWAAPYVASMVEAGLIDGVGGNRFAPLQTATRAESVKLILSLLDEN
ncbi:Cellulosome-anchoring protein precursor [compost metagenome]